MVSYTSSSSEAQKQQGRRSEYQLHSVHRPPATGSNNTYKKPLNTLAQLASGTARPRVYNVKPVHFRELVQRLTGAPSSSGQLQSQSQRRPQPPPVSIPAHLLPVNQAQMSTADEPAQQAFAVVPQEQQFFPDNNQRGEGLTTELMLSPHFQAWFSLALLSPGSVL